MFAVNAVGNSNFYEVANTPVVVVKITARGCH